MRGVADGADLLSPALSSVGAEERECVPRMAGVAINMALRWSLVSADVTSAAAWVTMRR
jgi:hypothetical protein